MYAWVTLRSLSGGKKFNPGDEVSKEKMGCTEADWKELIANGSVREEKFPQTDSRHPSPYRVQMAKEHPNVEDTMNPQPEQRTASGSSDPGKS